MTDKDINTSARAIALEILLKINEDGEFSHIVLNQALEKYAYLGKADRAFISRLVHGSLEYQLQLDYIIGLYSSTAVRKLKPVIRELLRMSVYQIMHMDRVPDSAVCNEAVRIVNKRRMTGLKGFVNAVLRKIAAEKDGIVFSERNVKYSMPDWIVEILDDSIGKEAADKAMETFLKPSSLSIRVNTGRLSVDSVEAELVASGISSRRSRLNPDVLIISGFDSISNLECIAEARAYIQDTGSSLAAKLAGIREGDRVIDLCAAPGGKSLHAADILKGGGRVDAFDISEYKLEIIDENIRRYGFTNIFTEIMDASVHNPGLDEKADVVIADLPCSGLGIIGSKPDIKKNMSRESCEELAKLQYSILKNAAAYVKPGGRLVYSTCTIDSMENQDNLKRFLGEHREFKPVDLSPELDVKEESLRHGFIQLIPGVHESEGFFISVMEKERGND